MAPSRPNGWRRIAAAFTPLALALGALPLLAPTCGGSGGVQTFARSSLIIPMDLCYQSQSDTASYTPASCPQAADPGNVIRAYGLVYQLVRNNIAVYWIIAPSKPSLTAPDLTVQYGNGFPAFLYDWSTGNVSSTPPTSGNSITYIGGPFVVDGSDFARASAVLQNYKSLYGNVNVHVSNVAFSANVAKTMAGGWSAGGSVPPKLALLDIGSSGAGTKNSEVVIQGYLTQAGLDFAGAAGTATGTHGQIYDRLLMEDFWPDLSGNPTSSNLFKNGYQILWVPHWAAPSSCSDCTGTSCSCNNKYTAAQVDTALRTMGAFSAAGKDVFAECAGLGSFEGVFANAPPSTTGYSTTYRSGATDNSTHFQTQTPTGVWINESVKNAYFWPGNFSSPLLQLGDFPFKPLSGAIQNYQASSYKTETKRLISDQVTSSNPPAPTPYDVFTLVSPSAAHGTIVYLGGHSYSGTDGPFQIAGTRLVLNTLFNLGAACVESGVACNTGKLGVCAQGTMRCDTNGQPTCVQTTGPTPEICDGLDNDCNGLVDEGLDTACYDGPSATRNVGICHDGVRSCVKDTNGVYGMSACNGEVLPSAEVCNGLDDDCNGYVDDAPVVPPATPVANSLAQACYTGPSTSLDPTTSFPRGICKAGVQTCSGGVWSACPVCPADAWQTPASYPGCEILPQTETCGNDGQGNQVDMNCNGIVAEGCGCTAGATQSCYRGPSGTLGVGACKAGTQTCVAGNPNAWSACGGDVLPGLLDCTKPPTNPPADDNCNGVPDYQEPGCNLCPPAGDPSLVCYDGPAGTAGIGPCRAGVRSCTNGVLGTCSSQILPSPEVCDGRDNDCNGLVDDGATCGAGLSCVNGACVPSTCGVEQPCPEGYQCDAGNACVLASCGDPGAPCADGSVCRFGLCIDPCAGVTCGAGTVCASGTCTAGGCYNTGCPAGQLCRNGACVADACVGVAGDTCPSGTFCRGGDCVQACVFQRCPTGQRCGVDGFCVDDACSGISCAPDQLCVNGACVVNRCLGVSCGPGLVCQDGACVDDPCAGIQCPAGQCLGGQCYSTENPLGLGAPPPGPKASSGCGCGSGAGSAFSGLLLLLALPLARRRRGPPAHPRVLVVLVAALALGGAACKHSDTPFDPSQCQETCGEQRCVDLRSDPVHCATCDHACGTGEACVDAVCGPASAVAPYITSSDPQAASKGAHTIVVLTGERFATGATVRTIAPSGTQTYPASVTDAGHLSVDLDFTTSPTTRLSLRVVNPDRVISNAFPFDVITPTPTITGLSPTSITSGNTQELTVTGSGFVASSQCHVKGPTVADQALPTVPGADVACTFDTSGFPAGAYELWIVNEGSLASNHWPFQIAPSGVAHLTALSPAAAASGDVIALLVTGSGFDASSIVTFDGVSQTTTFQDPSHLLVPQITMPACATSCSHTVSVTSADNSLTFTVSQTAPRVDTMSVSPTSAFQGDTVTLTFTGANLGGATGASIQPPVGGPPSWSLGTVTSSSAAVTVNLATCTPSPCPAGLYTAALTFPTGNSSSFQFRVLSNVAVLQSASPAGGPQGTGPLVTLTGSNLRGTSGTIVFEGPGILTPRLIPASGTNWVAPTTAKGVVDLTGLDTGVYKLSIQNTGATASNQVSFSVTPGMPSVASVSPTSVTRQDTPVTVTISGTNFAKPDANGNAASAVMFSSDGGTTWAPLTGSPVTVVGSTSIQIAFDSRTAVPGTYNVAVWNPPGPQKSNGNVTFTVN